MKRKLRLLVVVMVVTMMLGTSISAFAKGTPKPSDPSYNGSWYYNEDVFGGAYKLDELVTTTSKDGKKVTYRLSRKLGYDSEQQKFEQESDDNYTVFCVGNNGKTYSVEICLGTKDEAKQDIEDFISNYNKEEIKQMINSALENFCKVGGVIMGWTDSDAPAPDSAPNGSHEHNFQWQTITAPTIYADGLEAEVCSICGERRNEQPLSAYGYALNQYATPMINSAQPGHTITFEFGEWNSFPRSFMEKIAAKNGATYVFKFKYNHQRYTVCIPAGTKVDLNEDWYGPLKLAELYGAIVEQYSKYIPVAQ